MRATVRYRQSGALARALTGLCLLFLCVTTGHASVAVLLEEPYGHLGIFDSAGHVAIYLDHVCAATPVSLRVCRQGEVGVVISRYDGIGSFDWVAMPLIPYLYAVQRAEDIPIAVRGDDVERLRDTYRRTYLGAVAPDLTNGEEPDGNWYELAGAAFDRSIYGFQVRSTTEQDAQLIAQFNDHKNQNNYNGAFRNCADFARATINTFYPHAVRRNFVSDFGLSSPKSVARGLTHYAAKHPELGLQAFVISQISGDAPRSYSAQGLAEGIIKKFGVPLLVVSPATTAALAAAWVSHGRFAEPRHAPVLNLRAGLVMEGAMNWSPVQTPGAEALATAPAAIQPSHPPDSPAALTPAAAPAGSTAGADMLLRAGFVNDQRDELSDFPASSGRGPGRRRPNVLR